MSHYVVTGGAGFIGSAIVRQLLAEGANRVVVIDNLLTGHERNLEEIRSRIDFQHADIRNYQEIAPLIRGAAVVSVVGPAVVGSSPFHTSLSMYMVRPRGCFPYRGSPSAVQPW